MNRITLITLIGLASSNLLAQTEQIADPLDLTGVAQILRPNDAQGVALGITGVAFREGLFAGYTNPAGLIFEKYSFGFSHVPSICYIRKNIFNQEAIALGIPLKGDFSISAQFYNLDFGKITVYDIDNGKEETKKSGIAEFQLSVAKKYIFNNNRFSLGITCKYLNHYMPGMDSDTYLFDFGFRYTHIGQKWCSFGTSISNIGKDLKFFGQNMGTPLKIIRVGASFGDKEFNSLKNVGFMSTIEYQNNINNTDIQWNHLGIGLEIIYFNSIFTRLGYNFDYSDNTGSKIEGLTYGLGVITPKPINICCPTNFTFEYGRGLSDHRNLDVNIISISAIFNMID